MVARRLSIAETVAAGVCFAVICAATTAYAVTDRHVQGIITAVDGATVTIQGKHTVTGRIDPKTRILLNGKRATVGDLKVTYAARAEMNLDEAWVDIEATR